MQAPASLRQPVGIETRGPHRRDRRVHSPRDCDHDVDPAAALGDLKKPAGQTPSIAISDRTGFILIGEGPGSVIQMTGDGGGGSWDLIKIFKNSSDITIRDLVLDGNRSALINVDPEEQTHCLKIGGGLTVASGDPRPGYVRDVKVYNVHFRDADGDGIFVSGAGKYTEGADVSDISIVNCRSTGHGRNGLSVQKCVQKVRIFGFHTEGNDNAAIDLEPTGSSDDDAPRDFKVMYCTLADQNASTRMSLSGLSSVVPPRQHARLHRRVQPCGRWQGRRRRHQGLSVRLQCH